VASEPVVKKPLATKGAARKADAKKTAGRTRCRDAGADWLGRLRGEALQGAKTRARSGHGGTQASVQFAASGCGRAIAAVFHQGWSEAFRPQWADPNDAAMAIQSS